MLSKVLLFVSAVSATNLMIHPQMKRDLQARQTDGMDGLSTECQSAIIDIYQSLPTPPPKVLADAQENPQTDPCDFTTPASLSKEYASYSSQVLSWYLSNADDIYSAVSECSILSQYATMVPICATDASQTGAASTTAASTPVTSAGAQTKSAADSTKTDAADSTETDASATEASATESAEPSTNTNAAGREGAMIYAAAAVAGIVVAVM